MSDVYESEAEACAGWAASTRHGSGQGCEVCDRVLRHNARLNEPERHEFHLLDPWHAYCICGWTGNDRLLSDSDPTTPAVFIGNLYREHLG